MAAFLALRITERGIALDRAVVEAAALLHDVDKLLPEADPLRAEGHGAAGATWLTRRGHTELARAVANHPATLLSDEEHYPRWAAFASREERIVAYADKRATQDLVSLDERFRGWAERHPEHRPALEVALMRAERLERDVCAAAGISPDEVARLPWVAAAIAGPKT
ncbi:MAG TPA: HD domain-containing protein [Candidatus Caenarcaniphilales bacterium]|nr:HD domain-containing protein [Candidatus Caenarcaniphilales bacterium]